MKYKSRNLSPYLFLLPAFIIYISVIVFPVFYSVFISLFKWNGISEMVFVGASNYINLFTNDPVFLRAVANNLIWTALSLFVTTTAALALAVVLNKKFRARTFFRGYFYFPAVIAPIAVAIIWRWIYNPQFGFINSVLEVLGMSYRQSWISSPSASLYAIFVASLWQSIGQPMILFLAGLQTVPTDVLEAATIDGASNSRRFFVVVCPMMRETFVIAIANLIVAAMKVYDIVQGLTGGGPNNATQMLSTYMYFQTFQYNKVSYGTTVSCLMVVFMLVVIVPYVMFTAKEN